MKKIFVDDFTDLADIMYSNIRNGCEMVSFIGMYQDTKELIEKLLGFDDFMIYSTVIKPNYNNYNKEYLVVLDNDMNIYCEKAYQIEYDEYLYICTDCIYIADDCNSVILKNIESKNIYEVSFNPEDDKIDTETNYKSESSHISRTKDGRATGFTKCWSNIDPDGTSHYSSYSYYGSNENIVKKIAKEFEIEI